MPRSICAFNLALLLLFSDHCWAEDGLAKQVDDSVRDEMQSQHIPGVALLVNKDGKIVLAKGYGLANVEHQVPVKPETVFQSGSTDRKLVFWRPHVLSAARVRNCNQQTLALLSLFIMV